MRPALLVATIKGRDQSGPSLPRLGLKTHPPAPASDAASQDTGQRHAQTRGPPQKHAQPVAIEDTGRWTVSRDSLLPLERSSPPIPGECNVHRDALHYKSYSNDGTQVPAPKPISWTRAQNLG